MALLAGVFEDSNIVVSMVNKIILESLFIAILLS